VSALLAVPVTTGAESPSAGSPATTVAGAAGSTPAVAANAVAAAVNGHSVVQAATRPATVRARSRTPDTPTLKLAAGPVIAPGEILLPGRALVHGANRLLLTRAGNLELLAGSRQLWSSNTSGHPLARAQMQSDGNFVLRTRGGRAIWSSRTSGRAGARLIVRKAAQVIVQSRGGRVLWRTTPATPTPAQPTSVKGYAIAQLNARGWGGSSQWQCLESLWQRESGWSYTAYNPSGAYGIPQALPGSKMSSAGADWRTNPFTQIRWGLSYIASRYGSPCGAWSHSEGYGWY